MWNIAIDGRDWGDEGKYTDDLYSSRPVLCHIRTTSLPIQLTRCLSHDRLHSIFAPIIDHHVDLVEACQSTS